MHTNRRFFFWLQLAFILGIGVGALNFYLSYQNLERTGESRNRIQKSEQVINALDELLEDVIDAQNGVRGYIIAGRNEFLEPYLNSTHNIDEKLQQVQALLGANASQIERFTAIEKKIKVRFEDMTRLIAARREQGFEAAAKLVQSGDGKFKTDSIRRDIAEIISSERERRMEWAAQTAKEESRVVYTLALMTVIDLIVFCVVFYSIFQAWRAYNAAQAQTDEVNGKLQAGMDELFQRNCEMEAQRQMTDMLQAAVSLEESWLLVARFMGQLLPGTQGRVYLHHHSHDMLEAMGGWGEPGASAEVFEPQACWALRRSQPYSADNSAGGIFCGHINHGATHGLSSLCLPLLSHGETLGLICVEANASSVTSAPTTGAERQPGALDSSRLRAVTVLGEQAALALSNMRLREALHRQSISDGMTGLHNRRFLDETLPRELLRAARKSQTLAVIMLDVDHFKHFNDTHGHDAGDIVLRSVADTLRAHVRGIDLTCRYGGEEFTLVFPEMSLAQGVERAERIREAVSQINLAYGGQPLGRVTISLGVALYPKDGETAGALLHAADAALYRAKQDGRNRVMTANAPASNSEMVCIETSLSNERKPKARRDGIKAAV